jgi:hypothetical protein
MVQLAQGRWRWYPMKASVSKSLPCNMMYSPLPGWKKRLKMRLISAISSAIFLKYKKEG